MISVIQKLDCRDFLSKKEVTSIMSNKHPAQNALPVFSAIKPKQILPALKEVLNDNRAQLATLLAQSQPFTWQNLMAPLESMSARLHAAWSPVAHLHAVCDSEELRAAYDECLPLLAQYSTEIGQNEQLFKAIASLKNSSIYAEFERAQKKILDHDLRDFHLSGVDLPPKDKERYAQLQQAASTLQSKFEQNILDATEGWTKHITTADDLKGLPEHAIASARSEAEKKNLPGFVLTLKAPHYMAVVEYADNRELRRELYEAYVTRASDQGPQAKRWDNSEVMVDILKTRHEEAKLLGFGNFAELSLATKMAKTPTEVLAFLGDLAHKAKPLALAELQRIKKFAQEQDGLEDIKPWDLSYYSEKLRQQQYAVSQEELRPYFTMTKVLQGLFNLVERLFKINIKEVQDFDRWHQDVRLFAIHDAKTGELRSQFYIDLYARDRKRGGAWMDDCHTRRITQEGHLQIPVAYLVCNFSQPLAGKPALLTHDEVQTLFHEFGHGLHHMLSKINYAGVSGINGVPWDAVEFPSQFMENWAWQPEILKSISGHHETSEPLPDELITKLLAAKNFNSALQLLRQSEFSLFDFRLHLEFDPAIVGQVQQVLDSVREQTAILPVLPCNRFQHSFSHIFAGGYAAGYYSYKWAEVLASDAFSRFEEEGILNEKVGLDFLHCILEQGGAQDPMELFKQFRGREPRIDALLAHNGFINPKS